MLQCPFLTPFRTACLSLAQRLINTKGKAATVHFTSAEAASSLHLARCSDTVQLLQDDRSDPQQRHVDEEVAHGGEDVAAHLPPQLLRVHLGPQPLDAEHAAGPATQFKVDSYQVLHFDLQPDDSISSRCVLRSQVS